MRVSFRETMMNDALDHAVIVERLLDEVRELERRTDMSTVRIPELLQRAEIHARMAEVYSRLAGLDE